MRNVGALGVRIPRNGFELGEKGAEGAVLREGLEKKCRADSIWKKGRHVRRINKGRKKSEKLEADGLQLTGHSGEGSLRSGYSQHGSQTLAEERKLSVTSA